MATCYVTRAFRYKKDGKTYNVGKAVEIDDKDVADYLDRRLVSKDKPEAKAAGGAKK